MAGARRTTLLHVRAPRDGYAPWMALGAATARVRLVTPRWLGAVSLIVAAAIHGGTMAGASQLPRVSSWIAAGWTTTPTGAIDVDLEPEELATVGPVPLPEEAAAPPRETPAEQPEEERAPETSAARVATATTQSATVTDDAADADDEGDDEDEVAARADGAGSGTAPAVPLNDAPNAAAPQGGLARYGIGDGVNEYGDPIVGPNVGLGGDLVVAQHALAPADAAPTTTPSARLVTGDTVNGVLNGTVQAQDKKKGITFPGAGVVSGTVTTAVRALPLPHNARGTIEVTIAPGGKVTSTRVVTSSAGDASTWDGVAKAIQGSLAGQTLDLGDVSSRGAMVRVTVTQKHVYPTGTAKGADVKPVCANQVINDVIDAADNKPADPKEGSTVPLFTDEHGRPCIPVGVSAVADASNIGANKHIEVQASMDVTIPGQKDLPEVTAVNTDAPWVNTPGKEGPRPTLPQKMRKRAADKKKKK